MAAFQNLARYKTILIAGACIGIAYSTAPSFAGFEWVPQSGSNAAKPTMKPAAPVPVVQSTSDDDFLPLPMSSELEPIDATPPMAEQMPEPVSKPAPMPKQEPVMKNTMQETDAPTRLSVMPREEPNSGSIAVESMNTPLPPLEPLPAPAQAMNDDPETLKKPPFDMQHTRVIMPEDAPANAKEQANVAIVPFPSEESLDETQENVMSSEAKTDMAPAETSFENAVGFAEDVPLALALSQVVPADYAYSFGQNVNPGLRVSWNGGKPWNEVISDMMVPLGYSAYISQKAVFITKDQSETMLSPSVPMTPSSVEPAAGAPETVDGSKKVERERNIKRVNIVDPGVEDTAAQKPGFIEKVSDIFDIENNTTNEETIIASNDIEAAPAPVAAQQKITFWTANAGSSLKDTLSQWSETADAELVWNAEHDYQLSNDFEVQGSFEKAVDLLLKHGVDQSNASLDHSYVSSSSDNMVKVLITNKG